MCGKKLLSTFMPLFSDLWSLFLFVWLSFSHELATLGLCSCTCVLQETLPNLRQSGPERYRVEKDGQNAMHLISHGEKIDSNLKVVSVQWLCNLWKKSFYLFLFYVFLSHFLVSKATFTVPPNLFHVQWLRFYIITQLLIREWGTIYLFIWKEPFYCSWAASVSIKNPSLSTWFCGSKVLLPFLTVH